MAKTKRKIPEQESTDELIATEAERYTAETVESSATEDRIRTVLSRTINHYESYIFPEAYDIIKQKLLYSGDRMAILIKAGIADRSNLVYPLISSVHDTFCANLYDTETKSTAVAREEEDVKMTQDAQDFFDRAYSITNADDVKEMIRNEASLIGTSYGMAGFESYSKTYSRVNDDEIKTEDRQVVRPTLEHVSFFDMFYEPGTNDFYKARWKARRKLVPYKQLENDYSALVDFTDDIKNQILNSTEYISQKDYKRIWDVKIYEKDYIKAAAAHYAASLSNSNGNTNDFVYDNFYQVVFKDNEICEVIEYWEDNKLILLINGHVYYDGVSPYPLGDPFGIIVYEVRPGTCRGIGIGHKLMSHQKQINTYRNAAHDAINMHIRPMYVIQKNALKTRDGKVPERVMWKDGGTLESSAVGVSNAGITPLQWVDFNVIQFAQNAIKDLLSEAQEIIGTNSYVQGGQGKVERSFGAVNAKLGVVRSRLQTIIKSINRFDEKMFSSWLSTAAAIMPESLSIRILGDSASWRKIKPLDILDKFDVIAENEANRQATKDQRVQATLGLLQSLVPYALNPITQMPNFDPADVVRYAFDSLNFTGVKVADVDMVKKMLDEAMEVERYKQSLIPTETGPRDGETGSIEGQIDEVAQEEQVTQNQNPFERLPGETDEEFFTRTGIVGV